MSLDVRAARGRPVVQISLSSESRDLLDALATAELRTRSGMVERLIRMAACAVATDAAD